LPIGRFAVRCKEKACQDRVERERAHRSNENKMSDGGRGRASLEVEVWKSFQKWSVQRSAVRSIAWLGLRKAKCAHITDENIPLLIKFICRNLPDDRECSCRSGICVIETPRPCAISVAYG
jgi:hypothetical protein